MLMQRTCQNNKNRYGIQIAIALIMPENNNYYGTDIAFASTMPVQKWHDNS